MQALAAVEVDDDLVRAVVEPGQPGGEPDPVAADDVGEQCVQRRPGHQQEAVIGVVVPLGTQRLPGRVEEPRVDLLPERADVDTGVFEHPDRVGPQADPGPGGANPGRLLQDGDVVPDPPQGRGGGEPDEAAAA